MCQGKEHGNNDAGDMDFEALRRRRPEMRWTRTVSRTAKEDCFDSAGV